LSIQAQWDLDKTSISKHLYSIIAYHKSKIFKTGQSHEYFIDKRGFKFHESCSFYK